MGNICGKGGKPLPRHPDSERTINSNTAGSIDIDDEYDINASLRKMQEYHLNRLRNELEKDPHGFILDNLLMCVQFFDNFEKSVAEADEYRRSTEKEMTELLSKDPLEGMVLGERRIKLLTGISHILAKNYIYEGKNQMDEGDEIDDIYGGAGMKDSFMSEGILTLDFSLSWDNIELYDSKEFENLREKDYSDAKGAAPIARLCMEQPSKRTDYPKGYVRLRVVDNPISLRRQLELPMHHSSDFGYAGESVYNKTYSDGVPEANSESDSSAAPHSGTTSEDEDDMAKFNAKVQSANLILPTSKKGITSPPITSSPQFELPSTSKAGLSKPIFSKLQIPEPFDDKSSSFPSLVVHAPTPPVHDSLSQMSPFANSTGLLYPHAQPGRILNQFSRSLPSLSRNAPGRETTSSGYDTTSTMSRSSSMQSSLLRDRWQKQNLKRLWEYGKKSRKDMIPTNGKYDPIPPDSYSEIKYESTFDAPILESDEEEDEYNSEEEEDDDEDDDDESVEEFDFTSGRLRSSKQRRKNLDDEYEMRFYLNSSQFSSNACSEFHYVGPSFSIPETSLTHGVVLGTTIRCPIPYSFSKDREDEDDDLGCYSVTYTFTPSLHSKTWPEGLYFHFNQQIFNHKRRGEMWPSRQQMEKLEQVGCNAIPLGYRAIGFFNAEQILEWELNFLECERNLLDSFRHAQWRTYIFSSILFRGFIAPLGPQGIGLEHVRNILYCMCYDDFSGWNDEQPGLHLKLLISHLYDCLGRKYMPSFFVKGRNLLQSIPEQNLRFVQGHLNKIRENLIIYCIYAFRNLMDVRKSANSYKLSNFKSLYEILTVEDVELLRIKNPILRMQKDKEDEEKQEKARQRARKKKKKQQKPNLLDQQDEIDKSFFATQRQRLEANKPQKKDKVQSTLKKEYKKHEKRLEDQKRKDREAQKLKHDPEHRLPETEKRPSIDLKKAPVMQERFSIFRLLLSIQFFMQQFLDIARKATDMQNYGLATMYVFQIENLLTLVQEERYQHVLTPFEDEELDKYRTETLRLRGIIGDDMKQYILSRVTSSQTLSSTRYLTESTSLNSLAMTNFPSFTNNWDLRKLPTPPPSEKEVTRPVAAVRKLEKPNMVSSLQSFDNFPESSTTSVLKAVQTPTSITLATSSPKLNKVVVRRQESIKFVSSPSTPPTKSRSNSRPPSRQSTMSLSLEHLDDDSDVYESTDL